jgi:hypothetical protein
VFLSRTSSLSALLWVFLGLSKYRYPLPAVYGSVIVLAFVLYIIYICSAGSVFTVPSDLPAQGDEISIFVFRSSVPIGRRELTLKAFLSVLAREMKPNS